jgi:hypothetical protein
MCSDFLEREAKMIPCTDFIPAYSELFKYLHKTGGKGQVVKFWEYLSNNFLVNLRDLAAQKGLAGCFEYWNHTLSEEAAEATMELDEEQGFFRIDMHYCPSMGRLIKEKHIEPYDFYCEHCDTLYRRVLEPLGFDYEIDLSKCKQAKCSIVVRKAEKSN